MSETSPPLKIWMYSIISVLTILIFSAFFLKTEEQKNKADYDEIEAKIKNKLIKNNNATVNKPSVVFLGSSLIGHALYNTDQIASKFNLNQSNNLQVCTIAVNALNNQKIKELHIFENLIQQAPDYLIIETNHVLIDNKERTFILEPLNKAINNLFLFGKKTLGMPQEHAVSLAQITPTSPLFQNTFDFTIYKKLLQIKRSVRRFDDNKILNKACKLLQNKKTKIIFLDLPRAPELDKTWLNNAQKRILQSVFDKYKSDYKINVWKYPHTLNNSHFTDGGHLNYKGAKKYQDWLITQFNAQQ